MKRILLSLLILSSVLCSYAQPQERILTAGKQSDGAYLYIYKEGDGQLAFFTTVDGYAVLHETDGSYYYASTGSKGLTSSGVLAHNPSERSEEECAYIESHGMKKSAVYTSSALHRSPLKAAARMSNGLGEYGMSANGSVNSIGKRRIPVIMVSFPDRDFLDTVTIEKMSRYFNEVGYHDEANTIGSVRDYFISQSDSMFQPSFEVLAKVKVSQGYSHYGANSSSRRDPNLHSFIKEAIDSAEAQGVDFTPYLENGRIPLISVYHAGPGEHSSWEEGYEDYLWAQYVSSFGYTSKKGCTFSSFFIGNEQLQSYRRELQYDDQGNPLIIDGEKVYKYYVTGTKIDGMGVFCHEFGHALGLPDFYDTATGGGVVDSWSVMDYGQYVQNGYRPLGYSAYERNFVGWLKITDLEGEQAVTVYPISDFSHKDNRAYRIVNPDNDKEYFIIENRQLDTWYPEFLGHGLLIFHVDYLTSAWSANTLNRAASHHRYQVFPADGNTTSNFPGDVFPGTTNTNTIESFPVFTGGELATPIYDITEEADGSITFKYLSPTVGINRIPTSTFRASIYTLDGRKITNSQHLPSGIYLINNGKETKKVYIR